MSNEKVKEKVEKSEEVEELSKKEAEEVQAVAEEEEQEIKTKFTDVKKLKCDYTVYKRERTNLKMPVVEECQKCGKKFKDGDELYSAYIENKDIKQNYIICKNCAK